MFWYCPNFQKSWHISKRRAGIGERQWWTEKCLEEDAQIPIPAARLVSTEMLGRRRFTFLGPSFHAKRNDNNMTLKVAARTKVMDIECLEESLAHLRCSEHYNRHYYFSKNESHRCQRDLTLRSSVRCLLGLLWVSCKTPVTSPPTLTHLLLLLGRQSLTHHKAGECLHLPKQILFNGSFSTFHKTPVDVL